MDFKEASPYMSYWENEEKDVLKEHYCAKCEGPLFFRECERCGHKVDAS